MTKRDLIELFFGEEQVQDITSSEFVAMLSSLSQEEFVAMISMIVVRWGKTATYDAFESLRKEPQDIAKATALINLTHRCINLEATMTKLVKLVQMDPSTRSLNMSVLEAIRLVCNERGH